MKGEIKPKIEKKIKERKEKDRIKFGINREKR
jgi:hypothetical protein